MKLKYFFVVFAFIFLISSVKAHCPLCTIGAGAAAGVAVWLGVSKVVVALFVGGFAVSMGWWFGNVIKKKYVPFQKSILVVGSFLLTVLPLLPVFNIIGPFYVPFIGEYGTTYAINYSLISSIGGGLIVASSPFLSSQITKFRNKTIPFQGVILTFVLLAVAGVIIQVVI